MPTPAPVNAHAPASAIFHLVHVLPNNCDQSCSQTNSAGGLAGTNGGTIEDDHHRRYDLSPLEPRLGHDCNTGGLRCKYLLRSLRIDYERTSLDMSLTQELFARDLEQTKRR